MKDHFNLSISLPDEDEDREYALWEILCKIAKRDVALSFEVWEWVLSTFLPYTEYAWNALYELTGDVIDRLYRFPQNYTTEVARYMDKHPDFMDKVVDERAKLAGALGRLIAAALRDGLMHTGFALFRRGLVQAGNDWKQINDLV